MTESGFAVEDSVLDEVFNDNDAPLTEEAKELVVLGIELVSTRLRDVCTEESKMLEKDELTVVDDELKIGIDEMASVDV